MPIINPRLARDSTFYRDLLRKQFCGLTYNRDSMLFDISGDVENQITQHDISISTLENECWDVIYDAFNGASQEISKNVKKTFNLSDDFVELIKLSSKEQINSLKSKNYLSFCIPKQDQAYIIEALENITVRTPINDCCTIKFWSSIISICKENMAKVSAVKLGICDKLATYLHDRAYTQLSDILTCFPISLTPRFDVKLLANILVSEGEELHNLFSLRDLQVLSGYKSDKEDLINKFQLLKQYQMV